MEFRDKLALFDLVKAELKREFDTLMQSALEAKKYATDEESKAENKYDTRGLEASYLAQGQAKRAEEVKMALGILEKLEIKHFDKKSKIEATALIEVLADGETKYFLMIPSRGGHKITYNELVVQSVSPESPIGQALHGRRAGSFFDFNTKNSTVEYEIINVI